MKWKAIYDAESDVPAELKQYYHLKDGKWVFNFAEFDGLAELSNPALNATKEDILRNKKDAERDRDEWKRKAEEAERKVSESVKPGMVTITEAEKADFDKYKSLGTVKDVQTKLENEKVFSEKLKKYDTEKDIRLLAQQTEVDADALVDFKLNTAHGEKVTLGKEKRKVKVGKNEVEKDVLVVIHTDEVNGEKKTHNQIFSEFATEKGLPKYIVQGIYAPVQQVDEKTTQKKREFHIPDTSTKKVESEEGVTKVKAREFLEKSNKSQVGRKLPWMKTPEKQET